MSIRIRFSAVVSTAFLGFVASSAMLVSTTAWGQGIPGPSVNIIGFTPEVAYMLPDKGLKQQNEVQCAVRPGDSRVALCGYNDYRTTEKTDDAWVGMSMTRDGGLTWTSRLAPGWPYYLPEDGAPGLTPLGHDFAADPNVAAVPGLALFNFIATDRGTKGAGGLFLQRWFESDKENGFPYLPSKDTILITKGTSCPQCSGRFIDKPHMIATLNPVGAPVPVSGVLEDGSSKEIKVPAGELHVVYSVFMGKKQSGSKILHSVSKDWGQTWSVDSKITESVEINQSAHLVARGEDLLVVWRRFDDNNESNAVMRSLSSDRGQTWGPPEVLWELNCPYDQPTRNNMFRTTVHPVAATDGSKFYTFWSARGVEQTLGAGTDSNGNSLTKQEMNCQFGLSRIVMSTSEDGLTWSEPEPVDMAAEGIGHQFMPAVAADNGVLQLVWYDSRDSMLPVHNEGVMDGLFYDKDGFESSFVAKHSVDVRGKQITSDKLDNPSVRISRYPMFQLTDDLAIQLGHNFVNARMFAGGKVPFVGDYISVAAPSFRLDSAGNWQDNQGTGALEPPSFYAAWTDNRDVRGDAWGKVFDDFTVYAPGTSANIPPKATNDLEPATETVQTYTPRACVVGELGAADRTRDQNVYATTIKPGAVVTMPTRNKRLGALQRGYVVNVENADRKNEQEFTFCIDGQPDDYENPVDVDYPTGLASFQQYPAPITGFGLGNQIPPVRTLNVSVPAQSNSAQSVYVTSTIPFPHIPVSVYKNKFECFNADGSKTNRSALGELVSTIVINGDRQEVPLDAFRDLQQPDADPEINCSRDSETDLWNCGAPTAGVLAPVTNYELHDPQIINYIWTLYNTTGTAPAGSVFDYAIVINPLIMTNDGTTNPLIMTREVTNPLIMTRDSTTNPLIMTRDSTTNPLIMTRDSTTNPLIMTKEDVDNPLIMTRDDVDNPLIMTRDGVDNPLIMTRDGEGNPLVMTRDQYDNPLIMTKDELTNPLIMTRDAEGNPLVMTKDRDESPNPLIMDKVDYPTPLIMTRDGAGRVPLPPSALCAPDVNENENAVPTYNDCDLSDVGYVEVTWLVENDGNVITAYNAIPYMVADALYPDGKLIPTQLIVTKPYLTYARRECVLVTQVISQVLLNTANPFVKTQVIDESTGNYYWDGTYSVDKGKATFFSSPGEEITITLRIFDENFDPRQLGFGVYSQSCPSTELNCQIEPNAAIRVDTYTPGTPTFSNLPTMPVTATGPKTTVTWNASSVDVDNSVEPPVTGTAPVSCGYGLNGDGEFTGDFDVETTTTVSCTATDSGGNVSDPGTFDVTIVDKEPPTLVVPTDPVVGSASETDDGIGAYVTYTVTATDWTVVTTTCSHDSGSLFDIGDTEVSCTATDSAATPNKTTKTFIVRVVDATAPVLTVPENITANAVSADGVNVEYSVTATDWTDVTTSCTPATGELFPIGATTVQCTATDSATPPNVATETFTVTVVDAEPPVLSLPADMTVAPDGAAGATVTYEVTATDWTEVTTNCTPASGSLFLIGTTTVECTATDSAGTEATGFFNVTVEYGSFIGLGLPNGMTGVDANGFLQPDVVSEGKYSRTIPLTWQFGDSLGNPLASPNADPVALLTIYPKLNDGACNFDAVTSPSASSSGNSVMRYTADSMSWKFNWKPSIGAGCYGVTIAITGQQWGPYRFDLK